MSEVNLKMVRGLYSNLDLSPIETKTDLYCIYQSLKIQQEFINLRVL